VTGKVGLALDFNGSSDYVDMGDVLDMGKSDWTLAAWFKTSKTDSDQIIVGKRKTGPTEQGYRLVILSANKIQAELNDGTHNIFTAVQTAPAGAYQDGAWHLGAAVYDRDGNMSLYVDGDLEKVVDISDAGGYDIDTDVVFSVGAEHVGTSRFFDGVIDEVRVWNRALEAREIEALYDSHA